MEILVLNQIQAELNAQDLMDQAALDSRALPIISTSSRPQVWEQTQRHLTDASRLRQGIIDRTRRKAVFDSLVQLYYALEKSGIIQDQEPV